MYHACPSGCQSWACPSADLSSRCGPAGCLAEWQAASGMKNFLHAQQVCAVPLVQLHRMSVSSCPYVMPQSCSLRCDFLLARSVWRLLNPCLQCGHGSAVMLSLGLWIAHLSQGARATAGKWDSVHWETWELIWYSVLCACSGSCAYRNSRPAFCKTNPWRMGLQVFFAKEYVHLQDFFLQDHIPCDCNIHLQPFLKMLLAKAAYKV